MKTLSNTELASLMGFVLDEAQKVQTWSRNGDEYLPDFTLKVAHRFEQLEKLLSVTTMSDEEFHREAKARGYVEATPKSPPLPRSKPTPVDLFVDEILKRVPCNKTPTIPEIHRAIFEAADDVFKVPVFKGMRLSNARQKQVDAAIAALSDENWEKNQWDKKQPWPDKKNYLCLEAVLREAYDQAAVGKGAVRHADGKPFDQQPMQRINDRTGPGFTLGQALKKVEEAIDLPYENKVHELLGAINYIAGSIIWLRNNPPAPQDEDEEEF